MPRMLVQGGAGPALLFAALLAACSTVPDAVFPPHQDCRFEATYAIGDDRWFAVPASTPELVIRSLVATPPAEGERFVDGRRELRAPAGCRQCVVHCTCRVYGQPLPPVTALFPGASQVLARPEP